MYLFSDGDIFEGYFSAGASVKGKYYYKNGDVYDGCVFDGLR